VITYPHYTPHFTPSDWTLPKVLAAQAGQRPDAPFLSWTDEGEPLTFGAMDRLTWRLARGLQNQGVGKGDYVALFLPNCAEFVPLWFAVVKLGAVEVPIAESSKGGFLDHLLSVAPPKLILTTVALAERITGAAATADLPVVLVDGAPGDRRPGVMIYEDLLDPVETPLEIEVAPSDLAAVLFTSGTTGPSKGVLMTHSQFYFVAEQGVQLTGLTPDDVYMTGFPLIHGNAQFLTVYPSLIAGAQVVLYPRFSASDWSSRVRRSGATVTNTIGATMSFICAQPPRPDEGNNRLRCVYAAPLSPDLASQFTARFGVNNYVNAFGQTEISLPFMTPPGTSAPANAMGVLVDQWFEVMLADPETDLPVADGAVGELLIRPKAPNIICSGYSRMPEKSLEAQRNLWFHTGDAMRRDANGWFYFADRVKDALRRRGENISSFEVESVVRSFPDVAECAVIGVPADEAGGENEVMAFIVLRDGAHLQPEALIAWCDERMPYFMVPRYLEAIAVLPQTPSEKVQKAKLRERGVTAATWDRLQAGCKLERESAAA